MAVWRCHVTQVVPDRCGIRFRLRQIKEGHVMPVATILSKVSGNSFGRRFPPDDCALLSTVAER